MLTPRIKAALVVLAASAGLSACTSYGSPYGGSGVGVSVGYGSPYGYGYGSPYGYGYGGHYGYNPYYNNFGRYPYFGWYDGFYYPGTGYWVYDPGGGQHPITRRQSNYWAEMLKKFREERGARAAVTQNFAGFRAKAKEGATITGVDLDAVARADAASVRRMRREAQVERQQAQAEQRAARSEARAERQQSVRERVIERRRARKGGGG